MPEGAIYVGRPTKWGNPFRVAPEHRAAAVDYYRQWIVGNTILVINGLVIPPCPIKHDEIKRELAGHDLACWCKEGESCHADVLLKIANEVE